MTQQTKLGYIVKVDASAGPVTLVLPPVVEGAEVRIQKADASDHPVTVVEHGRLSFAFEWALFRGKDGEWKRDL